jgi:uncharacterized protein
VPRTSSGPFVDVPIVPQGARRPRGLRIVLAVFFTLAIVGIGVLAAIPPLVTRPMTHRHVDFGQTWSGDAFGLEPERVVVTTADGLALVAFAVDVPAPKAVVVFLSGTHNPSVTAFFGHAAWLAEHGYASFLLELRAHGESAGDRIGLGYDEVRDVQAAVEHLADRPGLAEAPIVVFGLSLGGATAINAVGSIPAIDGVVSLSAFSSWSGVFVDAMGVPEPLATVQRAFVSLYTGFTYGFDRRHLVPDRQIRALGDRPALLVHARDDGQVPLANFERIVANAPPHVETWVREGDAHLIVAEGAFLDPAADAPYAARVLGFLERHFGP